MSHHFVQERVGTENIVLGYLKSKSNLANIFSKQLSKSKCSTLRIELRMC